MDLFKWDTLTDGAIGAGVGAGVVGVAALLTGGLALVPALAAVGVGTALGAIHGAGDEGGECKEVVEKITKVAAVTGGVAIIGGVTAGLLGASAAIGGIGGATGAIGGAVASAINTSSKGDHAA